MSSQDLLFADSGLPPQLVADLRDLNPWWEGDPMPPQPRFNAPTSGHADTSSSGMQR